MFEFKRKLIHIIGFTVPVAYFFLPREVMLYVVGIVCLCAITIELLRFLWSPFNTFIFYLVGQFTRAHEKQSVTGATYYFIAAFISILCYTPMVAIVGLLFLVVGDSAAALIGTRYGTHAIGEKSLEGSLACFFSCAIIGALILGWGGLLGAVAATLSELAPLPLDDNLRIPLISGCIMQIIL